MKVLVDTNIVLDVLLDREIFAEEGTELFDLIEAGRIQGFITATTITNIFSILRKILGRDAAMEAVRRLFLGFKLCAVDRQVLEWAINKDLKDFEDGVQVACAAIGNLDAIVTRDTSDFMDAGLPVLSVAGLIASL